MVSRMVWHVLVQSSFAQEPHLKVQKGEETYGAERLTVTEDAPERREGRRRAVAMVTQGVSVVARRSLAGKPSPDKDVRCGSGDGNLGVA